MAARSAVSDKGATEEAAHITGDAASDVLPLENGDRLTRWEFERRYEAMPHVKKAELVEGVVYMPSPVRLIHAEAQAYVVGWLAAYRVATPDVRLVDNGTVRLDADNEVQPDALLWLDPAAGGSAKPSEDGYLEGAPELIVEVAASRASYDLHEKLKVYRRNGVQEYVVWRVYDKELDWLCLDEGEYVPLDRDEEGLIKSNVFPGLWLAVPALLEGDMARVLAKLQEGLASEEHKGFVERLGQAEK
jgi:Uma2 family endonuclease